MAGALLAAATGCGQGLSTDELGLETEAHALSAAVERTTETSSGRFETSMEISVPSETDDVLDDIGMTMTGSYDLATGRSQVVLGYTGLPAEAVDLMGGEIVVITAGAVTYMQMPTGFTGFLGGEPGQWIRLDPGALGAYADTGLADLSIDPATYLDFLRGASEDGLVKVGTEAVRGVETTHFQGTFTLRSALEEAADAAGSERLDEFLAQVPDSGGLDDVAIGFDAYVDGEGLVRRVTIDLSAIDGLGEFSGRVTTDYFDFGAPVDIQIPPPEDTIDIQDLMQDSPLGQFGEGWPTEGD